eukprot:Opistho-2@22333
MDVSEDASQFSMSFQRKTGYCYLRVRLTFPTANVVVIDGPLFKNIVVTAMRQLHGAAGAALPIDVLSVDWERQEALLRSFEQHLPALWGALTLLGTYDQKPCHIEVLQTSSFLLGLACDSRRA